MSTYPTYRAAQIDALFKFKKFNVIGFFYFYKEIAIVIRAGQIDSYVKTLTIT